MKTCIVNISQDPQINVVRVKNLLRRTRHDTGTANTNDSEREKRADADVVLAVRMTHEALEVV
jgi:hypothetical protein